MRASLIGRFLLLAILWLMLLLPLWYWAARWLAVPAHLAQVRVLAAQAGEGERGG